MNQLKESNVFGEISAITNLRRTTTVIAEGPMLLGLIKINKLRELITNNQNFERKLQRKILRYDDLTMKTYRNMIT